jgi:DNA-binding GntR family transcriptional regulator
MPSSGGRAALVAPSVRSLVETQLRNAIVGGRFAPGTHLSDRLLCEEFGVSRSIIREATRLLEAEGLVTVIPRRGPFVAVLSAAEAVQIYEVRAALEACAGQGFAERASDEERAKLEAVFADIARMDASAAQADLLEAKRRFYAVLMQGCRNAYVGRMLGHLLNRNNQLRAMSLSAPGRLPNTIRELRRIMEAIRDRDGEGCAAACRDHVKAAAVVALRFLRAREHPAEMDVAATDATPTRATPVDLQAGRAGSEAVVS